MKNEVCKDQYQPARRAIQSKCSAVKPRPVIQVAGDRRGSGREAIRTQSHYEILVGITALLWVAMTPTPGFAQATFTFLPGHPESSQKADDTGPIEGLGIAIPRDDPVKLTDAVTISGQIDVTVADSTTATGESVRRVTVTFTGPEGEPGRITNTTDRTVDLPFIRLASVRFDDFPGGKGKLSVKFEGTLRTTTGRSIAGGEIFQLNFGADNFSPAAGEDDSAGRFFYASQSDSPGTDPDEPLPAETPMQGRDLDMFGVGDGRREGSSVGEFRKGAATFDAHLWLVLGPEEEIVAPDSVEFAAEVSAEEAPQSSISVFLIIVILAVALLFLFVRRPTLPEKRSQNNHG